MLGAIKLILRHFRYFLQILLLKEEEFEYQRTVIYSLLSSEGSYEAENVSSVHARRK